MTVDDFTARLNRWAIELQAAAATGLQPAAGASLARSAMDTGVTLYDDLAASDPAAFTNPLDVLEAATWLTDVRGLTCDGTAAMVGPWVGYSRIASGGAVQVRKHTVHSGDTLQSIAARLMGDWRLWAAIADANGLDPAASLAVGTILTIPEPDQRSTS